MGEIIFQVENLSVGYHGNPLISNIQVELERGSILTLIGPNGAGKTTILKSITRQIAPISGAVYFDGKSLEEISRQLLSEKMAVVLTDPIQAELLTCRELVATGRYPYTGRFGILSKKDWEAVDLAMKRVQVEQLAERDFRTVSDGQRQRVLLARAICQEPELLVLDEPTSFLDIRHKLEFMTALQEMAAAGMTIIMSLHELDLAQRVSDKILCVKGNWVDRIGESDEIFQDGYIDSLYGVSAGSYCEATGCVELQAAKGEPEIFIIAGGGCGSAWYRKLQRRQIPFATGILQENDLDYPVAKALATRVHSVEAFAEVDCATLQEAKEAIDRCQQVLCPLEVFGKCNDANRILKEYAIQTGKLSF